VKDDELTRLADDALTAGPQPGDRCLSIRQPWAWLILTRLKVIEKQDLGHALPAGRCGCTPRRPACPATTGPGRCRGAAARSSCRRPRTWCAAPWSVWRRWWTVCPWRTCPRAWPGGTTRRGRCAGSWQDAAALAAPVPTKGKLGVWKWPG